MYIYIKLVLLRCSRGVKQWRMMLEVRGRKDDEKLCNDSTKVPLPIADSTLR